MKRLILLVVLAILGGCPGRGPAAILTDQPQARGAYRYIAVDKDSSHAKTIETMLDRKQIVSRYAEGGDDRVAYVVHDGQKALFDKVPFQPLEKATLVVHVSRVSDINGWGAAIETARSPQAAPPARLRAREPRRRVRAAAAPRDVAAETVAATWSGGLDAVTVKQEVALFEVGYILAVEATLVTGNPFDEATQVSLYGMFQRSGYTRL